MNDNIADQLDLNKEGKEQLKKIVLARLNVMPKDVSVTIGSENLKREELVEHVRLEDEVGKQMIEMELEFLKDLASGAIYGQ